MNEIGRAQLSTDRDFFQMLGNGYSRVQNARVSPKRLELWQKHYGLARTNGRSVPESQQYADFAASPWRALRNVRPDDQIRTMNALLGKDDWLELDDLVVSVARQRLIGVGDLQSLGLVKRLGGWGTKVSTWQEGTQADAANVSMGFEADENAQRQKYAEKGAPVPIIHQEFHFDARDMDAASSGSIPIDLTHAAEAAASVAEAEEELLFNGGSIKAAGHTLFGYTTHTDRQTGTASGVWSTDINTTDEILITIRAMVAKARAHNHNGPYNLYVEGSSWDDMEQIYTDGSGQRAIDRAERLGGFSPGSIKRSQKLAAGNVVLVQMDRTVIDIAIAQELMTIQWEG
ncbi:hypothetical protein LCGC14_2268520, partial [marine sediment metagenome]